MLCINVRYTRNDCMSKSCCHFWDVYSDVGSIWLSVNRNIWLWTEIYKTPSKTLFRNSFYVEDYYFCNFSAENKLLLMILHHNHGSIEQPGETIGRIGYVIWITFAMFGINVYNWSQSLLSSPWLNFDKKLNNINHAITERHYFFWVIVLKTIQSYFRRNGTHIFVSVVKPYRLVYSY